MTTILTILGVGVLCGAIYAIMNKENPLSGAMAGGFMAGSCMLQLLVPVFMLLIGFWLFSQIFG